LDKKNRFNSKNVAKQIIPRSTITFCLFIIDKNAQNQEITKIISLKL